jgi:hypothetical protein
MFSGGMMFILPVLYAFFAFIFTAIMCWVYNLVAGMTGGIEVEIETTDAS